MKRNKVFLFFAPAYHAYRHAGGKAGALHYVKRARTKLQRAPSRAPSRGNNCNALHQENFIIKLLQRLQVKPSIDVVVKIANALDTTVGYLLGEAKNTSALKDQAMLKRINDINNLPLKDKECILYAIDGLIKAAKLKAL